MPAGEPPRLLLREQGELDRIAARLREGRRVVVFCVCSGALRPAALARLREKSGVEIPEPASLASPDETLARLTELSQQLPTVVASFSIDAALVDVLRTINWHREKLRRGGSALIWLEDERALRELRSWAPDAYSFRDALVLLHGEPRLVVVKNHLLDESPPIKLARLRLENAITTEERSAAAAQLSAKLFTGGSTDEPRRLLHAAFEWITAVDCLNSRARAVREELVQLLLHIAWITGRLAEAWRWAERLETEPPDSYAWLGDFQPFSPGERRPTPIDDDLVEVEACKSVEVIGVEHHEVIIDFLQCARDMRLCGEVETARRILEEVLDCRNSQWSHAEARRQLAVVATDEGSVEGALQGLREAILEAARLGQDEHIHRASSTLVEAVLRAHEVDRADAIIGDAQATLTIAEEAALAIASEAPPWYPILFPALRAELLALQPEHLDEAISLLTSSLDRARAVWTDAAPMHARKLVHTLLRAGRLDDARAALAVAIPEAEAQRHFKELAALQAAEVAVLARSGAAASDVSAALDRLRATFDASGSRRLTAETVLDLVLFLPPATSLPDPLPLLEEAHDLFMDMPMPAQEARCLEAMGDVLAARSQPEDARHRYLQAKGILEQYGLDLRLPLLTSKLAQLTPVPPPVSSPAPRS